MTEAPKRRGRPPKNTKPAPVSEETKEATVEAPVEVEVSKPAKKAALPALLKWRGRKSVHAYEIRDGKAYGVKINPGDVVECHEAKTVNTLTSLGAVPSNASPDEAVRWSVYTN